MRILFFSPWPPQRTGIADYAYGLVKGLVQNGYDVTVITEADVPKLLAGVEIHPPIWLEHCDILEYDRIVYQVGNNSHFHLFMMPYLFRFRGVIHLHDLVLHHLMAYVLYANGNPQLYLELLNKWYGPHVVSLMEDMHEQSEPIWESEKVTELPLFEEVLQYAEFSIIHSRFAQQKILATFPNLACHVIPQVYEDMHISTHDREKTLSIGIFGGVDSNKRTEIVLHALSQCMPLQARVELNIVGSLHDDCIYLKDLVQELGLGDVVTFHGRVSDEKFIQLLHATDLCISLRYPTMGETSAIVMRALQSAIPVVVSDVGWYKELPGFVQKIKPVTSSEIDELTRIIRDFAVSSTYSKKLKTEAIKYAEADLNFDLIIKKYSAILSETQLC